MIGSTSDPDRESCHEADSSLDCRRCPSRPAGLRPSGSRDPHRPAERRRGPGDHLQRGSTTQAVGTITYDDFTNELSWSYTYGDNAPDFDNGALFAGGNETVSHFHGPAAAGATAGVQVGINPIGTPNTNSATISEAQEADLLAGLWYVNIHSSTCSLGEIRGQVVFASTAPGVVSPIALAVLIGLFAATALMALRSRAAVP